MRWPWQKLPLTRPVAFPVPLGASAEEKAILSNILFEDAEAFRLHQSSGGVHFCVFGVRQISHGGWLNAAAGVEQSGRFTWCSREASNKHSHMWLLSDLGRRCSSARPALTGTRAKPPRSTTIASYVSHISLANFAGMLRRVLRAKCDHYALLERTKKNKHDVIQFIEFAPA